MKSQSRTLAGLLPRAGPILAALIAALAVSCSGKTEAPTAVPAPSVTATAAPSPAPSATSAPAVTAAPAPSPASTPPLSPTSTPSSAQPSTPTPAGAANAVEAAQKHYERAKAIIDDVPTKEALDELNAALALRPDFAEALFQRSVVKLFLGAAAADVAADLNKAIALKPDNGDFYQFRAVLNWGNRDSVAALADLDLAENNGRNLVDTANLRALIKAVSGDVEGALVHAEIAVDLSTSRYDTLDTRGFVRLLSDDLAGALADYKAALEQMPDLIYARLGTGIAVWRQGKQDEARPVLVELLKEAENDPLFLGTIKADAELQVLTNEALFLAGESFIAEARALKEAGQAAEGIAVLASMREWVFGAYLAKSYAESAGLYVILADYTHAVEHYTLSLKTGPDVSATWLGRAAAYEKLGDHDKARADAIKARALGLSPEQDTAAGEIIGRP